MKLKLIVALCLMTSAACADEARKNAIKHIANAIAVVSLCQTQKVNATAVALLSMGYKITMKVGSADYSALEAMSHEMIVEMKPMQEQACDVGMLLYGPAGENVPNLILER